LNSLLIKPPRFLQFLYKNRIWAFSKNTKNNSIFLTFDDGPIPEVTPWVLKTLKKHNAKATFFCIGDNVRKHPDIYNQILKEGHVIGNHTFHHLNGWNTPLNTYVDNVDKAAKILKNTNTPSLLFRPPYGKLNKKQEAVLRKKGYKIIMWNVLSGDYHPKTTPARCFDNVKKHLQKGAIVVFHDSLKAEENLKFTLPKILIEIEKKGLRCEAIHVN